MRASNLASSKYSRARRGLAAAAIAGAGLAAAPAVAHAHAFGQQFVLPLPISFYLYGGAAAVIASFVAIAWTTTTGIAVPAAARVDVSRAAGVKPSTLAHLATVLRVISGAMLLVLIAAGAVGHQVPADNLASVCVWIVGYLGVAYSSAVFGNVWSVINPFMVFTRGWRGSLGPRYPSWLGYAPAIALYYVFIWLELLSPDAAMPNRTAFALVAYYTVGLAGTMLLGSAAWLRFGDFLSVFFGLFSRLSPIEYRDGKIYLRWPILNLLDEVEPHVTLVFFVLLMFASTAFDGLRETAVWARGLDRVVSFIGTDTEGVRRGVETVALLVSPVVCLAVFMFAVSWMRRLARTELSVNTLVRRFALTLVPIAFTYHFAHYFTLLFVEGPSVIALGSDPFGLGWNLFGTAMRTGTPVLIDAKTVWNVQVAAIVIGHIASVFLAHVAAFRAFGSGPRATRSQLPMLALTVCYTVFGLWVLAQPMNSAR